MAAFIVFEGIDSSGKAIQLRLLSEALTAGGYSVLGLSYPVYSSFFGKKLGQLLDRAHSGLNASIVDPHSMALWYALDRWMDHKPGSDELLHSDFVLANRYSLSSMVYQSLRSKDPEATAAWVEELETRVLCLPQPELYIILDISPTSAAANTKKKGKRSYTSQVFDEYEADSQLQEAARAQYIAFANNNDICEVVSCQNGETLRTPKDIHHEVMSVVRRRFKEVFESSTTALGMVL